METIDPEEDKEDKFLYWPRISTGIAKYYVASGHGGLSSNRPVSQPVRVNNIPRENSLARAPRSSILTLSKPLRFSGDHPN